jgi:protein MpaA
MSHFGKTNFGFDIPCATFGKSSTHVLILGGVHGDETEGVLAANGVLARLQTTYAYSFQTTLVPAFNLDGVILKTRTNGRGVDLNRNLPTKDWSPEQFNPRYPPGPKACSEPENQALVAWLNAHQPKFVFSLHSFTKPMLNTNGDCQDVASAMHAICKFPIEPTIGYPTPGCLGTYAGIERNWPTITYELLKGDSAQNILSTHVDAIIKGLDILQRTPL